MTNIAEKTLSEIVTSHHQAVPVFEKHHLDFCCKGKRTLKDACEEKGLNYESIRKEVETSISVPDNRTLPFNEMNPEELISYILIHHHFYVKQSMPSILNHVSRVATKHGDRFPFMKKVYELFAHLNMEMLQHMKKEEQVLFPRIREVAAYTSNGISRNFSAEYIDAPISVMENEHEEAGEIMYTIRQLTNNYAAPEDGCTTFRVALSELKAFEEDLHKHVHLENNLLFPQARRMFAKALLDSK